MGFIADAMRIIENKRAEKQNRQRAEDYLRQLEIEELQRRAQPGGAAAGNERGEAGK